MRAGEWSQLPTLPVLAVQVFVGVGDVGDFHGLAVEKHFRPRPQCDGSEVDRIRDRSGVEEIPGRQLSALERWEPDVAAAAGTSSPPSPARLLSLLRP